MDQTTTAAAPAGGSDQSAIAVIGAPSDAGARLSLADAARALAQARRPKDQQQQAGEQRPQRQHPPAAQRESTADSASQDAREHAGAGDAGEQPAAAPPGEIERADPAANLPPIEPPRSWTKEDKELFASVPRATQERLAERERSRDSDSSRRQQQATEQVKALETEHRQAEQTRQHYEAAMPRLLTELQQQQPGDFSDIKTVQDLEQLAATDPSRFGRWQVQQIRIAAVAQELQATQQRLENEQWNRFVEYAKQQDRLLEEKLPELADKAKVAKVQDAALELLKGHGFSEKELVDSYNGKLGLHLRDHRLQLIVHDAMQWRDAQAKAKAASTAQLPPVQRPGVSQPRGAVHEAQIQNLAKRFETSGSLKDAAALLRARRAARR